MYNVITEIMTELSKLKPMDDEVAWQEKLLADKLLILEPIFNCLSDTCPQLPEDEKIRYRDEIFPYILKQCKETVSYYEMCPYLRYNEQNNAILKHALVRYNKMVDRFITRLQKDPKKKKKEFYGLKTFKQMLFNSVQIVAQYLIAFADKITSGLRVPKIRRRRTLAIYHRDTIDYAGGYKVPLVSGLQLDCA